MKEQLITQQTADLAQQIGFDVAQYTVYSYNKGTEEYEVRGVTQALLQKWLRDTFNCIVEVRFHGNIYDGFRIVDHLFWVCTVDYYGPNFERLTELDESDWERFNYGNYEDALEEGLQEAINLIIRKHENRKD